MKKAQFEFEYVEREPGIKDALMNPVVFMMILTLVGLVSPN